MNEEIESIWYPMFSLEEEDEAACAEFEGN